MNAVPATPAPPLHPEAVAGDPATLRWRVPADLLPVQGPATALPGQLGDLLGEGVIGSVVLEPDAVLIRAGDGHSWREIGARVRTALSRALTEPDLWQGAAPSDPDEVLRQAAEQVLAGPVGETIRGHGGMTRVVEVRDGVVSLALGGACTGCPARDVTLTGGFERELRARHPELVAVRVVEEERDDQRRRGLFFIRTRRAAR